VTILPENIEKILILRAGQLGDTVWASSIIEPLRKQFGQHIRIHWAAKSGIGNLFEHDNRIEKIYHLTNRKIPIPFNLRKVSIIQESLREPYDLIINLEFGNIMNDVMRFTRARHKVGQPYSYVDTQSRQHVVEKLNLFFESFLKPGSLDVALPSILGAPLSQINEKFNLPSKYIVVVPSNSHHKRSSKRNLRAWPNEHWKSLFKVLQSKNIHTIIVGGSGEEAFFQQFEPLPANIHSLVGRTSFSELSGIITHANAVITTDTGPGHIAAAVNTPVLAIIGPTDFRRTGPFKSVNNKVSILSANLPCSPCYHTEQEKNCRFNKCMEDVTPESVMDELLKVIDYIPHP